MQGICGNQSRGNSAAAKSPADYTMVLFTRPWYFCVRFRGDVQGGCLRQFWGQRRGPVVIAQFEMPTVGCPFAGSSRMVVCGKLGVGAADCVVLWRIEIALAGFLGFGFDN